MHFRTSVLSVARERYGTREGKRKRERSEGEKRTENDRKKNERGERET